MNQLDASKIVQELPHAGILIVPTRQVSMFRGIAKMQQRSDVSIQAAYWLIQADQHAHRRVTVLDTLKVTKAQADGLTRWVEARKAFESQQVVRQENCEWKPSREAEGVWEGTCGIMWELIEGDLHANGVNFCPECGGRINA